MVLTEVQTVVEQGHVRLHGIGLVILTKRMERVPIVEENKFLMLSVLYPVVAG